MRFAALTFLFVCGLALAAPANGRRGDTAQPAAEVMRRGTQDAPIFVRGDLSVKKDDGEAQSDEVERKLKGEADATLVRYTGWLAFFTCLLFVFTAFLWWVTWRLSVHAKNESARQTSEMKRSILEAVRSADAMEKVAVATVDNAALMSGIMQQQMRAYVSVSVGGAVHQTEDYLFEIRLTLQNDGLTPARNIAYRSMVGILPADVDAAHVFQVPPVEITNDASLSPRQKLGIGGGLLTDRLCEADVADVMVGKDRRLYTWGFVRYEDIFGTTWQTNFCQSVYWIKQPDDKGFRWHSQYHNSHNDST